MNKKKPYVPPIPMSRLEAMRLALIRHILAIDDVEGGEPLGRKEAIEIEQAITLVLHGPRRPPRATQENLRAAAVARYAIRALKVPQEVAVAVAFDNPNGVDVESLARTYRNLLPLLAENDFPASAEINRWLTAYYRTDHYKKKKAKAGKVKGK